ncbi:MAG: TolC family protein [Gammaproteobacteria bacterium]
MANVHFKRLVMGIVACTILSLPILGNAANNDNVFKPPTIPLRVPIRTISPCENPVLTLKDAIYLAMRHNPSIQNAELQRVIDKFSLIVTKNQYYPQLSLTAQALFQNGSPPTYSAAPLINYLSPIGTQVTTGLTQTTTPGTEAAISTTGNLTISQPLLRGFGRKITLASLYTAQDSEKINQITFKSNVIAQVISVISAYYQLVQAYNNLSVNQLALKDETTTLQQTQAKVNVGKAAPTEQIQQELNIANSQLSISQTRNAIQQSRLNLLNLLGLAPDTPIRIEQKIYYTPTQNLSLDKSIEIALAHNLDYQTALINYKIIQRNLMLAEDEQKWQLNAVFNLLQTIGNNGDATLNSRNFSLNLDVPIHDVSRQQILVNAKIALDQARINLAQQKYQLIANVTNAYNNMVSNKQQIQISGKTVQLAEQSVAVAKLKYRYGKTTSFELTSLQSALTNAQIGYISQQIQYINATEGFYQLLGTTLERWGICLTY